MPSCCCAGILLWRAWYASGLDKKSFTSMAFSFNLCPWKPDYYLYHPIKTDTVHNIVNDWKGSNHRAWLLCQETCITTNTFLRNKFEIEIRFACMRGGIWHGMSFIMRAGSSAKKETYRDHDTPRAITLGLWHNRAYTEGVSKEEEHFSKLDQWAITIASENDCFLAHLLIDSRPTMAKTI